MNSLNPIIQEIIKIDTIADIPIRFSDNQKPDSLSLVTKYGDSINIHLAEQDENHIRVTIMNLPLSSASLMKMAILKNNPEIITEWVVENVPNILTELT